MDCKDCPRWNAEGTECRDGKVNPPSWGGAVTIANVMGVRAICMFNEYRERLVRSRLGERNPGQCTVPTGSDKSTA